MHGRERNEERIGGTVICQIANLGRPELVEQTDDNILENQSATGMNNKVLFSYNARDEAMYLEEQRKHKEVLGKIEAVPRNAQDRPHKNVVLESVVIERV